MNVNRMWKRLMASALVLSFLFEPVGVLAQSTIFRRAQNIFTTDVQPPLATTEPLVAALVAEGLEGIEGDITAYLQGVSQREKATVLRINVPNDANPKEIAEGLNHLYNSGRDGAVGTSQLKGVVLLGDVPVPIVSKNGRLWPSVYPYTDFVQPEYEYNATEDRFVFVGGDSEPEVYHGWIKGSATEIQTYLQKNAQYHAGAFEYDEAIFYADMVRQTRGLNPTQANLYTNNIKFRAKLLQGRFTATEAEIAFNALGDDITPPLAPGETEAPEGFNFDALPDIYAPLLAPRVMQTYFEGYASWTTQVNRLLGQTGRWTAEDMDTPVSMVHAQDEIEFIEAVQLQSAADEIFFDAMAELDLARRFDIEPLDFSAGPLSTCIQTKPLFWYGVNREDLTMAEQCTILRGTPQTPSNPNANLIEATNLYDSSTAEDCPYWPDAKNKDKRKDPLEGCCGANIEFDPETGEPSPVEDLRCYVSTASGVAPYSSWDCGLLNDQHIGPEEPIYNAGAGAPRPIVNGQQYGLIGASGCAPIADFGANPTVGQVDSYMVHNEPTPETIAAQMANGTALALPVDDPRGVSFYDHSAEPIFQFVPAVEVFDENGRRSATDILIELEEQTAFLITLIETANASNPVYIKQIPPTDIYTTEGVNGTAAYEIFTLYDALVQTLLLKTETETAGMAWHSLPLTEKNQQAFTGALSGEGPGIMRENGYELAILHLNGNDDEGTGFDFETGQFTPDAEHSLAQKTRDAFWVNLANDSAVGNSTLYGEDLRDDVLQVGAADEECADLPYAEQVLCRAGYSFEEGQGGTTIITKGGDITPASAETPAFTLVADEFPALVAGRAESITLEVQAQVGGVASPDVWDVPVLFSPQQEIREFIEIQGVNEQLFQAGKTTFHLRISNEMPVGDWTITLESTGQQLPLNVRVVEDRMVSTSPRTFLPVDAAATLTISGDIVDGQYLRTNEYDGQQLLVSALLGNTNTVSVPIIDGAFSFEYTPGSVVGVEEISIKHQNNILPPLSVRLNLVPGSPQTILPQNPPVGYLPGQTVSVPFYVADTYGNEIRNVTDADGAGHVVQAQVDGVMGDVYRTDETVLMVPVQVSPDADLFEVEITSSLFENITFTHSFDVLQGARWNFTPTSVELIAGGELQEIEVELVDENNELIELNAALQSQLSNEIATTPSSFSLRNGTTTIAINPTEQAGEALLRLGASGAFANPLLVETQPDPRWNVLQLDVPTSSLNVGETVTVQVRVTDQFENIQDWSGSVLVHTTNPLFEVPGSVIITNGVGAFETMATGAGFAGLSVSGTGANMVPDVTQIQLQSRLTPEMIEEMNPRAAVSILTGGEVKGLASALLTADTTQVAIGLLADSNQQAGAGWLANDGTMGDDLIVNIRFEEGTAIADLTRNGVAITQVELPLAGGTFTPMHPEVRVVDGIILLEERAMARVTQEGISLLDLSVELKADSSLYEYDLYSDETKLGTYTLANFISINTETLPLEEGIFATMAETGRSTNDPLGVQFYNNAEESIARMPGSVQPSAEDAGTLTDIPWVGRWQPVSHMAAGAHAGTAAQFGASDAVVVLGDPTVRLFGENARNGFELAKDVGTPIWEAPAEITQVLSMDLNGDGQPEIVPRVDDTLYALYHDPDRPYQLRETGELLRLRDDVLGDIVKEDNNNDGFWGMVQLHVAGGLSHIQNENGVLDRAEIESGDVPFIDLKGGDVNADGRTDLVLSDAVGGIYTMLGTANGFVAPQEIRQFTPRLTPVRETYIAEESVPPIVPAGAQIYADYLADAYPTFTLVGVGKIVLTGGIPQLTAFPLTETNGNVTVLFVADAVGNVYFIGKEDGEWTYPQELPNETLAQQTLRASVQTYVDESLSDLPLNSAVVPYLFPHLSQVYVSYDTMTDAVSLEDPLLNIITLPSPLNASIQEKYIPSPLQPNVHLDLQLNADFTATVRLKANVDTTNLSVLLPEFGALVPNAQSLTCTNCGADFELRSHESLSALWAHGITLGAGQSATLTVSLDDSTATAVAYDVQMDDRGGHRVVVPWTENDAPTIETYYAGGWTTAEVQTTVPPTLDDFPLFEDQDPDELRETLQETLIEDRDGDGLPDMIDPYPDHFFTAGTDISGTIGQALAAQKEKSQCGGNECGNGFGLPSVAFLAPGNFNLYVPPFSFPVFPSIGLPVIWLPPPPVVPSHLASAFRLYIMPTTSLRVGIGICAGPFGGFNTPAWIPNCLAVATPNLLNFGPSCDADAGISCEYAQLMGQSGGGINTLPTPPQSASGGGGNIQGGGADFITSWVAAQVRELSNFKLPKATVRLPEPPAVASGTAARGLNNIPYITLKPKDVSIAYPQFPDGYTAQAARNLQGWNDELDDWYSDLSEELAQYEDELGGALGSITNELRQELLELVDAGALSPNINIDAELAQYMADYKASLEQSLDELKDYVQAVRNTKIVLGQNLEKLREYQRLAAELQDLPAQLELLKECLGLISEIYDTFYTEYVGEIKRVISRWVAFRNNLTAMLSVMEKLPNIFSGFAENCGSCEVHRGKGSDFLLTILLGWLKLPVFRLPTIPDIIVDLSDVQLGLEVEFPRVKPTPVQITAFPLPQVPEPLQLPKPSLKDLDLTGMVETLRAGIDVSLPDAGDLLDIDVDGEFELSTDFDADEAEDLPDPIELPDALPELNLTELLGLPDDLLPIPDVSDLNVRELPDITIPKIEIKIPEARIPSLFLPPEPPADIPNILEPLEPALNAIDGFLSFFCLLTMGLTPLAEWDLKAGVERMTNRSVFIPFDFSPGALTPPHRKPELKPLVIKPSVDLRAEVNGAGALVNELAEEWNCLVEQLSSEGQASCESAVIGDLIGQIPEPQSFTEVAIVGDEVYQNTRPTEETRIMLASANARLSAMQRGEYTAPSAETTQMLAEAFSPHVNREMALEQRLYQHTAQLDPVNIYDLSALPTQVGDIINGGEYGAVNVPEGVYMCEGGVPIAANAQTPPAGVAVNQEYLKPDYHVSDGLHDVYGESAACAEGTELLQSFGARLYLKSCSAQYPAAGNAIVATLSWERMVEYYVATEGVFQVSSAISTELDFARADSTIPYFEWTVSERPDALFELMTPDARASEMWERIGFLVRREPRKYEIRPMTTKVVSLTGSPKIFAPEETLVPTFTQDECNDPSVSKPYYAEKSIFVGESEQSRLEIQVPPRPDQPEEQLEITLRKGEETLVTSAYVCATSGEVYHIGTTENVLVPPRENLYLPNGTRFELGAGDEVQLELFDGSLVTIYENETYQVRLFEDENMRIQHLKEMDDGYYYGLLSGLKEGNEGTLRSTYHHDPGLVLDTRAPQIELENGFSQRVIVNTSFVLDARGTTDESEIVEVYWDLDAQTDSDGDGIPSNDRDFVGDATQGPLALLQPRLPGWAVPGEYSLGLNVIDAADNQATEVITITVTVPTLTLFDASARNGIIRGRMEERAAGVELQVQRTRNGITEVLPAVMRTDDRGEFELQF